jgi:hypothetical protein
MLRSLLCVGLVTLGAWWPASQAGATVFRLTDEDGVTHLTDAPTDPRYRKMSGFTGTASGWLRVPDGPHGRYAREIQEIAARYGVSPGLVEAVIRVESAFNPWAVSRKGAQGLMQLMPRTAWALGVQDSFNPRQNIEGGVRHLRYLLDRYPGNLTLALAAYNAGEGAVDYYRGIPPYAETQQYVQKVLQHAGLPQGGPTAAPGQVIYRWEDADGTLTFSNIPPAIRVRSGR